MKIRLVLLISLLMLTLTLMLLLAAPPLFAMSGREIMEKSEDLPRATTAAAKMLMKIHKGGRVIEKEFIIQTKQLEGGADKALISFIRPTKLKLLTHSHKERPDDQWLCLSSGRIKRVVASGRGKPFVNSHFYYEDLTAVDIDDYQFELIGEGEAAGAPCYRVEALNSPEERVYDKLVFYVRRSDFFVQRIDFFRDGRLEKYLENRRVETIDGILTPCLAVMTRADGKGHTELILKGVRYNIEIDSVKFEKAALR